MILIIAKVFAIILALLVVARSMTDYRTKNESLQMTVFWIFIWLAVVTVAVYPVLIDKAISVLGGSRTGLGTIFGMAIVFVLFICYRIYIKAGRVEKNLNALIRANALRDIKEKAKK